MVLCVMNPGLKRFPERFYRSDKGREPVREWLKPQDRKAIGEDILRPKPLPAPRRAGC
jgi:hypothetical protein